MRKRLACIIFLLVNVLAVICAINQDGHYKDSFELSAYNIGAGDNTNEYFALYVVDSIYDSFLNPADSIGNQIVIDNKVNYLFDDLQNDPQPRTATFNADTMIFHIIAMGNRTGEYSITLSFGPLKNEYGDVIDTAYTMGNARVNFENSESSISDNTGTYYYAGDSSSWPAWGQFTTAKWNFLQRTLTPMEDFTDVILDTANGNNLELEWMVYSSTMIEEKPDSKRVWEDGSLKEVDGYSYSLKQSDPSLSPLWISRAAVAMSIDKTEYDSSPEGKYKSEVIVTFTQK